jgi:hypothetical protein
MDAGAIRYFSDRSVYDVVGLNNAAMLHDKSFPKTKEGVVKKFQELNPRYFALFPEQFKIFVEDLGLKAVYEIDRPEYSICNCPAQKKMIAYEFPRADLPGK